MRYYIPRGPGFTGWCPVLGIELGSSEKTTHETILFLIMLRGIKETRRGRKKKKRNWKGAFPTEQAPPRLRARLVPHSTWRPRWSARASERISEGELLSYHGGPAAGGGCAEWGSGDMWSGADSGSAEAAAEPGR